MKCKSKIYVVLITIILGSLLLGSYTWAYYLVNRTDQYIHFDQVSGGTFTTIVEPNGVYTCIDGDPVCDDIKKNSVMKFRVYYVELIKGQIITHVVCDGVPLTSSWSVLEVTGKKGNYKCNLENP